jgi:5-methylcytosine-specific restriction endonuclease McrA
MATDPDVKKRINALLHELVRLRDRESCRRCGTTERLQLSHIYPKGRYRSMEFDPWNVKLLCVGCHLYWWHKNPIEAWEWLKTVWPEKELARLKLMSNTTGHRFDPKLHILYLKSEIARLKRGS